MDKKQAVEVVKEMTMESYSDSVTVKPPLKLPALHEVFATKEKGSSSRKRSRTIKEDGKEATTETMKSERDRRERMNQSYNELLSMLPKLLPKASQEKIVTETIAHIKALKQEIKRLEEQRNSSTSTVARGRMSMHSNNSSVNVIVSGDIVLFGIQSLARQGLVTDIFFIFHRQGTEVLAANVAVNNGQLTLTVTALVNGNKNDVIEKIKTDILIL